MKFQAIHSRRARYGSLTVALTVVLIAVVVLLNVIFSALASRFSWYIDMTQDKLYSLSDHCLSLLDEAIEDAVDENGDPVTVEIIFCEDYHTYEKGSAGDYIYNTAHELELAFPKTVSVSWFDCWVEKKKADALGVSASTNVVLKLSNGESRVFSQTEFYTFSTENSTTPIGYDGERLLATALVSMLQGERPLACLSVNHGEVFFDTQLLYLLRDAGYNYTLLDMYYNEIPAECELLICYNPLSDLSVRDGVSEISEIDRLERYLASGKDMMVFLSSDTPTLPNLEQFLGEYGVRVLRDAPSEEGEVVYNAMIRDDSASLSADGFTFIAEYATGGRGAVLTEQLRESAYPPPVVFKDATALVPTFAAASDEATYQSGSRTLSVLLSASAQAQPWASGAVLTVADTPTKLPLMTLTDDSATGGKLLVASSTEYAAEQLLCSAVYGNGDVLLHVLQDMGSEAAVTGLRYKPFSGATISTLTTKQTTQWTLALTLTPTLLVLCVATVILVRRKNT